MNQVLCSLYIKLFKNELRSSKQCYEMFKLHVAVAGTDEILIPYYSAFGQSRQKCWTRVFEFLTRSSMRVIFANLFSTVTHIIPSICTSYLLARDTHLLYTKSSTYNYTNRRLITLNRVAYNWFVVLWNWTKTTNWIISGMLLEWKGNKSLQLKNNSMWILLTLLGEHNWAY